MLRTRLMTEPDIALGMRLKQQAGWNQTEADWRRCLALEPDGCFVAELDSQSVGTVTTCTFGDVAWVAMVLVEETVRGRGIGRALMERALAYLESTGVRCVRLDATPLGRPLYEKLGFVAEYTLTRYDGVLPATGPVPGVESARPDEWEELAQIDQVVTGTDRRKLLARLFVEDPDVVRVVRENGRPIGFLAARPRSLVLQVGPCEGTPPAAALLLADAAFRYAGRHVLADVPNANPPAREHVERIGLTAARPLLRMYRGAPIRDHVAQLWAAFGPEMG